MNVFVLNTKEDTVSHRSEYTLHYSNTLEPAVSLCVCVCVQASISTTGTASSTTSRTGVSSAGGHLGGGARPGRQAADPGGQLRLSQPLRGLRAPRRTHGTSREQGVCVLRTSAHVCVLGLHDIPVLR